MTNRELGKELGKLVREERRLTNEILNLINHALERRAYLEHGFSSMFDWLVKGFGYSHSAAYRRIEAAKLLRAVPEAAHKISTGEVNLTTLSKAQSAIRAQEKSTGEKVSLKSKADIVDKITNKSAQEAEQVLCGLLPEFSSSVNQERRTVVNENTTRHSMNFSKEMSENLQRAKEVLSHKFPNASDAEILGYALQFFLDNADPLKKPTSAAASKRVTKHVVLKSSEGSCVYKDSVTGRVCGSRHQVEIDHVIPKGLGGTDDPDNLRPLCRQHNLLMAEHAFGKKHMNRFRKFHR